MALTIHKIMRLGTYREEVRATVLFGILFGLAAIPLTHNLTGRYEGHFEENSAWMSSAARNYLAHGYGGTRLAVADNDGTVPRESLRFYMSHPPLVPLLVSFSFQVFGPHEWSARIVPIGFTLASIVVIQRLGTLLGGAMLGWIAAFVYALIPMNAYFGRVTNHEPITLFMILLTSTAYLHWHRERSTRWLALTIGCFIAAALADWPGYYLGLLLPMHHLLSAGRKRDARVLLLPLVAVLLFGAHIAHISLVKGPDGLQDLMNKFVYRTQIDASSGDDSSGFSARDFIIIETRRAKALFTLPVLVLAGVGFVEAARRVRNAGAARIASSQALFLLVLLSLAGLHVVLFTNGAWVHDYWLHYFALPLALLAASGALTLTDGTTRVPTLVVFGMLFVFAAVPQTRQLQRSHNPIAEVADFVRDTSTPGQIVLGNGWITSGPRLAWHARRYVHFGPVRTLPEVATLSRQRNMRSIAYYRAMAEPLDPTFERWLVTHATSVGIVTLAGNVSQVYHAAITP